MATAVLKVSFGLIEAMLLPPGANIAKVVGQADRAIEFEIYGADVPDGCKNVRVETHQIRKLVPCR
jgi:hypothetical protein